MFRGSNSRVTEYRQVFNASHNGENFTPGGYNTNVQENKFCEQNPTPSRLFGGVSEYSDSVVSNRVSKWSLGSISKSTRCYSCERRIKEECFSEHLFFGSVKCLKCNLCIRDCQSFRLLDEESSMRIVSCDHKFNYTNDPAYFIVAKLCGDQVGKVTIREEDMMPLMSYLVKLRSLEEKLPWQHGIRKCRDYIAGSLSEISNLTEANCSTMNYVTGLIKSEGNASEGTFESLARRDGSSLQDQSERDLSEFVSSEPGTSDAGIIRSVGEETRSNTTERGYFEKTKLDEASSDSDIEIVKDTVGETKVGIIESAKRIEMFTEVIVLDEDDDDDDNDGDETEIFHNDNRLSNTGQNIYQAHNSQEIAEFSDGRVAQNHDRSIYSQLYDPGHLQPTTSYNESSRNTSGIDSRHQNTVGKKSGKRKKNRSQYRHTRINKSTKKVMHFIPLPSNGFYYVSKSPIEECPNCYEVLCPSQFTLNVKTFLLTTNCCGCDLTIYILSENVQVVVDK